MQSTNLIPGQQAPPDHKQLPCEDGAIVQNFQEFPQSELLTGSLLPRLHDRYPDGQFAIGQDSGIYWRHTNPPLDGCKAPDWFFVPGVPPMLDGEVRRSYVLWQESVRPLIVIEYVSGDGSEERDTTPYKGKFWVYERAIGAFYYAIFDAREEFVEMFRLEKGQYAPVTPNPQGRFAVEPWGVELGLWKGTYRGMETTWLRVWDAASGSLLPSTDERAEAASERAENAESLLDDFRRQAEEEAERVSKLREKLRAVGIDPDTA